MRRLLIDSHVALWWLSGAAALGPTSRAALTDADVVLYSAVTPWELGIKESLGKLTLPEDLVDALTNTGFTPLDITADHARRAAALPPHHRDPFDRMLIAQAQLESLVIVTADGSFGDYDVERLDART